MPFVSSDPGAWLRPFYDALAAAEGFSDLPIPLQFSTLVALVTLKYPAEAAKFQQIDDLPSQRAVLRSLANAVYPRPAQRRIELWRAGEGGLEARFAAFTCQVGLTCVS